MVYVSPHFYGPEPKVTPEMAKAIAALDPEWVARYCATVEPIVRDVGAAIEAALAPYVAALSAVISVSGIEDAN